jgi:2-polyprenyl-3-methyl-5-hydroxy-6-metoxy-1,4-benzoquinol methylase
MINNDLKHANLNRGDEPRMEELHLLNMDFIEHTKKSIGLTYDGKAVLDIGIGSGHMARLFLKKFYNISYTGVDFDNFVNEKINYDFIQANLNNFSDVEKLIFKNTLRFDVVFAFDILEHLVYFKWLLDNIHIVLKENGIVVVGLPIDINLSTKVKLLAGRNVFNPFRSIHGHINLFSYSEVVHELQAVRGLNLLGIRRLGLGYGLYDKKFKLNLLANAFPFLCSRVYLVYQKSVNI